MTFSSRNLLFSLLACGSVAALVVACGTEDSTFPAETAPPPFGSPDGGFGDGGPVSNDDLYKNDPPPPWCGGGAGDPRPPIGGTEECPDDKNKPGCGCGNIGDTAPCWTGLRRHRNLGICKDGVAKCVGKNETSNVWGECVGQVLPVPDGKGAEACSCFSLGEWKIANTSPCLWNTGGGNYYSYSTVWDNNQATNCGDAKPTPPAGQAPSGIWSTNTLKVDCAGTFRLCFKIRAGDFKNPKPDDCVLGEVCTDADYKEANVEQALPDLATWAGKDNACAKKWELDTPANVSPGYGEMIVKGQTVRCDAIDDGAGNDFVFHRVQYCPRSCRDSANANNPECVECQLAGKGTF
ncbi:MAG TPA: hypothetical protein VM925_12015 [Labilithrix sp.]|jgi:hypothetical protein|nr:hypothetical protein [Labilithrix sp.]